MIKRIGIIVILILFGLAGNTKAQKEDQIKTVRNDSHKELNFEDLLINQLEGIEDTEVIVSRVTIPPNTTLPKHWHPGEEFAYILKGAVVLWQEGKEEITVKEGEVIKVSLKQVHTAITKDEGAVILVFRVHELGKPHRTLVE